MTPELNAKIALWRQQLASGSLSPAEEEALMVEAVKVLRAGRVGAAIASDTSRRAKAKAEIPSADDLLGEMGLL